MIPFNDETLGKRVFPFVNLTLLAICVLAFFYELSLPGRALDVFLNAYGVVPRELTTGVDLPPGIPYPIWITLITSIFLHGGWLHLLGNMLYLFVFGDNVEAAMGHLGYLLFYLVAGILASLAQVFIDPSSQIPSVGASGAIAGVLGAYLVLFPAARVKTVIFFGFFFTITTLPAILVIGVWGVMQFFSGFLSLGAPTAQEGGVAYFAHIGGFVVGIVVGLILRGLGAARPYPRSI